MSISAFLGKRKTELVPSFPKHLGSAQSYRASTVQLAVLTTSPSVVTR